ALRTQQRMPRAPEEGRVGEEVLPIQVPRREPEPIVLKADEHPRPQTTIEPLSKLQPVFLKGGTVTGGSSSGLNDAASVLVIMSREKAEELGVTPLATIRASAVAGVDPNIMGIGPVPATKKVMEKSGLTLSDMDIIEINEAF